MAKMSYSNAALRADNNKAMEKEIRTAKSKAGHKKKNPKDQQWVDNTSLKYKVKKPTIKQKTLEFEGHLVPMVFDYKRGSVYRDYKNAWVVPCTLENNKEAPYSAMVRQYGNLIKKGYALVPTVHQLGKRDQVVQSAAMFKDDDDKDSDDVA